jgi:hypothetical protein
VAPPLDPNFCASLCRSVRQQQWSSRIASRIDPEDVVYLTRCITTSNGCRREEACVVVETDMCEGTKNVIPCV